MNTKGRRLIELQESFLAKYLLPQLVLQRKDWKEDTEDSLIRLHQFASQFPDFKTFVVRSSAAGEDELGDSKAGKYLSILNLPINSVAQAIDTVFESYESGNMEDEVLIQPYISDSQYSGVFFTHDPSTGSEYRIINYAVGSDTTLVTSGKATTKLQVFFKDCFELLPHPFKEYQNVFREICSFFIVPVDIEFIICDGIFYIVQWRPLKVEREKFNSAIISRTLEEVSNGISRVQSIHPYLAGDTTILGLMPDWNPAELIGVRPTNLALSIFRELITDSVWAYERSNLGYRNTRSFPLLFNIAGHPYIDLRTSINSMIPGDIPDSLANKLANCYLDYLKLNPHLHDKVEFAVYLSSWTYDFDSQFQKYADFFSQDEKGIIENSLLTLTKNMLLGRSQDINKYLAKIQILNDKFLQIVNSDLDLLTKIFWLIEDCKRYGTLPFAGIARMAFVATTLLNSMKSTNLLKEQDFQNIYANLHSPAKSLLIDTWRLGENEFLQKYGHLRPGTFDIRIPSYNKSFKDLFSENRAENEFFDLNDVTPVPFDFIALSKNDTQRYDKLCELDTVNIIQWCVRAIEARESAKFLFSRNISKVLDLVSELGEQYNLEPTDLAHSSIDTFLEAYKGAGDIFRRLELQIQSNKELYERTCALWFPPLIIQPSDISCFSLFENEPNFIGQSAISGSVEFLNSYSDSIVGQIVLIEGADPGFDWIFTKDIKGLITSYGGANSHMAVRCKELGVPAAIGVGEFLFQKYRNSKLIHLDCVNKRVEILQ